MDLFYGVAFICLGVVVAGVTLVGTRNPNPSKYFDGFVYLSYFVIAIISTLVLGTHFVISSFLSAQSVDFVSISLSIATIIGTIAFINPTKKKLNKYRLMRVA